jgi:hypothetical protein
MRWLPCDCPNCKEPSIQPMSVLQDRAHYRCGACYWSWYTPAPVTDGEVA